MAQEMPERVEVMFRSSDVTRIVGMQQDMIRLWRARGHLPKKAGRGAVYTGQEIAEIMVRFELSNYGIAPAKSQTIGRICAANVIRNAILNYPDCCEVVGAKDQVEMLIDLYQRTDEVSRWLSNCNQVFDFVLRRDFDELQLISDMGRALDSGQFKTAMVLNLQECARILVERSNSKLFVLEYPNVLEQRIVRHSLGST